MQITRKLSWNFLQSCDLISHAGLSWTLPLCGTVRVRVCVCVMTSRCLQDEERVSKLELELELQEKITEAALKLAKDPTVAKSVRKKRKQSYHKSSQKVSEVIIAQISMIESMEN